MKRLAIALLIALTMLTASGCQWRGLNSLPLPGTQGRGDGAWTVYVVLPDAATLDRNSSVLVDDVAVGRVADLRVWQGQAKVTLRLNQDVRLPANATAVVGQTTLLGSAHVELAPPETGAAGRLRDGDTVGLRHEGAYPTTEQTMASVALVLGGGGLDQVRVITTELDAALGGRTDAARAVIDGLNTLMGGLDRQKKQIVDAIGSLDDLASRWASQTGDLERAIDSLAPALGVLADRRSELSEALTSLGRFSDSANSIISASAADLRTNLTALPPILRALADSGSSLTESTRYLLTYPFPIDVMNNVVRGDYANGQVTLDLRLKTLDNALLLGTPLQGMLSGLEGVLGRAAPAGAVGRGAPPGLKDLLTPGARPR
ncbi:Mce family protein [Gordonia hirsuta DSM 44140 = NBRC 16056]|uniref:Mce family protein n=1 Tax=Gordonia hirsuta DSM 44140 = NBRC 16056 TaxID=1121927 RepID=L7L5D9_9ACTN|nr:MCE family protein [Gordonia hirsuta]GAC56355.1 Mce family protein [Gordonia hirsuta DSM 44140 = NBRC 16056]